TLPAGSTSIWSGAGFSAIAQVVQTDIVTPMYFDDTSNGQVVSQTFLFNEYTWNPVATPFTGSLNGNGHTISGIGQFFPNTAIGGAAASAGLFNTIAAGGRVANVGISNSFFYSIGLAGAIAGQ